MGYLSKSINNLDLVDGVDARAQAPVDAKDLVVNDAGEREVVKHVGKIVPDCSVSVLA